jgi:hypothetical protein
MQLSERWNRSKAQWNILTHYQRFESAVAFVLTVVIALEFNHTIRYVVTKQSGHHPDEDRAPDCASGCGAQVYHSGYT